jgi:hypothetical protein
MILPEGLRPFDNFATALVLDGSLLAAGAPATDLEGARNAGAVYLFQRAGNSWEQVARLTPEPPQPDGRFGSALALDRDILAIGAPYEYNPGAGNASGAVYVFTRSRSGWTQAARLAGEGGAPFDLFGGALALQGKDLAVGARAADGLNGERDAGAVHVFRQAGRDWTLQARLGGEASPFDHFGHALAFAGDELLVGAPDTGTSQAPNHGQVYVYARDRGSWTGLSTLTPHEIQPQARFGAALSAAGDLLAVLAPQEYRLPGPMPPAAYAWESDFGVAHVFSRQGGQWQWQARLIPEPQGEEQAFLPNNLALIRSSGRVRLALSGYGRGAIFPFELQGRDWQALPPLASQSQSLVGGQALVAASDLLLLGSSFYDIPQPGGNALQSAGVVWLVDW